MNTQDRTLFILGQFNTGLRTEWAQIEELENSLERRLRDARARATPHIQAHLRADWDRDWDAAQGKLDAIRSSAAEARRQFDAGKTADALDAALQLIEHDRALDVLLEELRTLGREAVLPLGDSDPWYDSWKLLWMSIDGDLATLRAHAVTTRFRLEMRKEYGADKADALTREILDHLPPEATLQEAEKFAAEYRRAHDEFEKHAEHPTIRDIIRSLFMLPDENTDDHLRRQRAAEARRRAVEKMKK